MPLQTCTPTHRHSLERIPPPGWGTLLFRRVGDAYSLDIEQDRKPAMIESAIRDAGRAYTTAFLPGGSAKSAEAVVLKNIQLMNSDGASGEELFQAAVKAAIKLDGIPESAPGNRAWLRRCSHVNCNASCVFRSVLASASCCAYLLGCHARLAPGCWVRPSIKSTAIRMPFYRNCHKS
jgi:hypothetical protein